MIQDISYGYFTWDAVAKTRKPKDRNLMVEHFEKMKTFDSAPHS